jgi:hypothetical protein
LILPARATNIIFQSVVLILHDLTNMLLVR